MTRKDYIVIAEAIRKTGEHMKEQGKDVDALLFLAGYLGSSLKSDNPRFDYERFCLACRVGAQANV